MIEKNWVGLLMGRRKHFGSTYDKRMRENARRQEMLRKELQGKKKPYGDSLRGSKPKIEAYTARQTAFANKFVELRLIAKGWIPRSLRIILGRIPIATFAKLRKHESTSVGKYCFIVDRVGSTKEQVMFGVSTGMDLTSKKREYFGSFVIDFKEGTIEGRKPKW